MTEFEAPAGVQTPLPGTPEEHLPESKTTKIKGSDPYRLKDHKRLGGSTPHPESQATAERMPAPEISEQDQVLGAQEAKRWLNEHSGPKRSDTN